MYVVVYCNEGPDSGTVYYLKKLSENEPMAERAFAERVAGSLGYDLAEENGYIPNCCGDIRVEFVDHEPSIVGERYQGSTRIWSGRSYYFATE